MDKAGRRGIEFLRMRPEVTKSTQSPSLINKSTNALTATFKPDTDIPDAQTVTSTPVTLGQRKALATFTTLLVRATPSPSHPPTSN